MRSLGKYLTLLALGITVLITGACSIFLGNYPQALSKGFPLSLKWSITLDDPITALSQTGDGILIVRTTNSVRAFDVVQRNELWRLPLTRQVDPDAAMVQNHTVYIADSKLLRAINLNQGSVLWEQALSKADARVVNVSDDLVIVDQPSDRLNVYNAQSGKLLCMFSRVEGMCPLTHPKVR